MLCIPCYIITQFLIRSAPWIAPPPRASAHEFHPPGTADIESMFSRPKSPARFGDKDTFGDNAKQEVAKLAIEFADHHWGITRSENPTGQGGAASLRSRFATR